MFATANGTFGRRKFTIGASILATVFWLADSIIHKFIYREEAYELIPSDFNELWMRILIVVLIAGFGLAADDLINRVEAARRDTQRILRVTVKHVDGALGNLSELVQLANSETDRVIDLDDACRKRLEQSIRENREQIQGLRSLARLTE